MLRVSTILLLVVATPLLGVAGQDGIGTAIKAIYKNGLFGAIAKWEKEGKTPDEQNMILKFLMPMGRHVEISHKKDKIEKAEATHGDETDVEVFPLMSSAEAHTLFEDPRVETGWDGIKHTKGVHTRVGAGMKKWLGRAREKLAVKKCCEYNNLSDERRKAMIESFYCGAAESLEKKGLPNWATEVRRMVETYYDEEIPEDEDSGLAGQAGVAANKAQDVITKNIFGDALPREKKMRTRKFDDKLTCTKGELGARARFGILQKNTKGMWKNKVLTGGQAVLTGGVMAAGIALSIVAWPLSAPVYFLTVSLGAGVLGVIQTGFDKIPDALNAHLKNSCDIDACTAAAREAASSMETKRSIAQRWKGFGASKDHKQRVDKLRERVKQMRSLDEPSAEKTFTKTGSCNAKHGDCMGCVQSRGTRMFGLFNHDCMFDAEAKKCRSTTLWKKRRLNGKASFKWAVDAKGCGAAAAAVAAQAKMKVADAKHEESPKFVGGTSGL